MARTPPSTSIGTDTLNETLNDAAGRLRFAVARMARLLRQQDRSGFGPTVVAALATIERHGPLTLGELASREQVAPPTITKVVEKLEQNGFVARTVDVADRRCTHVAVTPKGAEQLQTYRTRRTEWLTGRLAELTDSERSVLAAALPVLEQLVAMPEATE
jgi:DNA-binding MarR family transcriptional regulator